MFANILVAVDGSEHSKKALEYALKLAEKFDGKISLIHVYSSVVSFVPTPPTGAIPISSPQDSAPIAVRIAEDARLMGSHILDEAEIIVKEYGIPVEKVLKEGDVVREIVSLAHEGSFDLIVVGHRGLSRLEEILLGGVSEGVSHKAPCSVMIVK